MEWILLFNNRIELKGSRISKCGFQILKTLWRMCIICQFICVFLC